MIDHIRSSAIASALLFGAAYFVGAELAYALSSRTDHSVFVTLWPQAGLFVAALVLARSLRSWPVIIAVACFTNVTSDLLHGNSLVVSLGFCTARCVEAVIGTWLFRRMVAMPITLNRIPEIVGFSVCCILIGPMLGATIGTATVAQTHSVTPFWMIWRAWAISDLLGVMVFAPLIITWISNGREIFTSPRPRRVVECAVLLLGLTIFDVAIYGEYLRPPWNVPSFVLPFLLWAAVRFNPAITSITVLLLALIGLWNISHGRGPFVNQSTNPHLQIVRAQSTLSIIGVSVMLLAAAVAERKQAEKQKQKLINELECALNEIKVLRGLIPLCSWCRKIRDDQGFWTSFEVYLRENTHAEITHGICPQCMDKQIETTDQPETNLVRDKK